MYLHRDMCHSPLLPNNECGYGATYPDHLLPYLHHRSRIGRGPTTCAAAAAVREGLSARFFAVLCGVKKHLVCRSRIAFDFS
jgi:hypothetical protein